jgi:hypothetical protein
MEKVQSKNEKNAWLKRKNSGVGMDKVERGNVDRWMFGLLWRGKGRVEVLSGYEEKGEMCKSVGIRIMVTKG